MQVRKSPWLPPSLYHPADRYAAAEPVHFRSEGKISDERLHALIQSVLEVPEQMHDILDHVDQIKVYATNYANREDAFFLGRSLDYAVALEGALKLKEISYIHAEAYAAGELKHGTWL